MFDAPEWLYPSHIINKVNADPTAQQNSRQENVLGRLLGGYILNKLNAQTVTGTDVYPVDEYLNDLFEQVWKPLNQPSEWKNSERRNLQRTYVDLLDKLVNTPEKTLSTQRTDGSDVQLYLLQHLGKLEQYLKAQQASGLNALHYDDLLDRVQLIRDKRKFPSSVKQ